MHTCQVNQEGSDEKNNAECCKGCDGVQHRRI